MGDKTIFGKARVGTPKKKGTNSTPNAPHRDQSPVHRHISRHMGAMMLESLAAGERSGFMRASDLVGIHAPGQRLGDLHISFRTDWDNRIDRLLNRFHHELNNHSFAGAAQLLARAEKQAVLRHQQKDLALMWMMLADDMENDGPNPSSKINAPMAWNRALAFAQKTGDAKLTNNIRQLQDAKRKSLNGPTERTSRT
jgi:hypothetical protein